MKGDDMGQQFEGFVAVTPTGASSVTGQLDGDNARMWLGAGGVPGAIFVRNGGGGDTMALLGDVGRMWLGASGVPGNLYVRTGDGTATMGLLGDVARMWLGDGGVPGNLYLRTGDGADTIHLDGERTLLLLGGLGTDFVRVRVGLDGGNARGWLGGSGVPGNLYLRRGDGADTIHLDGGSGDVVLLNADCAEDFTVEDPVAAEPGTVMVLAEDELLHPSEHEYDSAVVGVVSGAGGLRPGIVLARGAADETRVPIALLGKVFCKADAAQGPIKVGDMLTTSSTVGHAMRAEPSAKAFGAVLGKALGPLREGRALVPVLIALQ
jgi:hypothetical protein